MQRHRRFIRTQEGQGPGIRGPPEGRIPVVEEFLPVDPGKCAVEHRIRAVPGEALLDQGLAPAGQCPQREQRSLRRGRPGRGGRGREGHQAHGVPGAGVPRPVVGGVHGAAEARGGGTLAGVSLRDKLQFDLDTPELAAEACAAHNWALTYRLALRRADAAAVLDDDLGEDGGQLCRTAARSVAPAGAG